MAFSWVVDPIEVPERPAGSPPTATPGGEGAASNLAENIDPKFKERYEKWKAEYLSTEEGRRTWARFAENPEFNLTLRMSEAEEKQVPAADRGAARQGARVDVNTYQWDASGKLVGATIVLGSQLGSNYPSSTNYPVTSSLEARRDHPGDRSVGGNVLAATKLAHELGHLESKVNMTPEELRDYREKLELSEKKRQLYEQTHDIQHPDIRAIDQKLGSFEEQRRREEHAAEAAAARFLEERLGDKMPDRVRDAIDELKKQQAPK